MIVGAGISGAVLAERYAASGRDVLVLDKRAHMAGNCYDFHDDASVLVSRYGAHIFHTNHEDVWTYVNRFAKWKAYEHRVVAWVDGIHVPVPVNITTVNMLFGLSLTSSSEMREFLRSVQIPCAEPKDGREAALALVGEVLYEKIFRPYTKKQWDKYPEELDASVLQRIPVRDNFDDRYFTDRFQALPVGGYTALFEAMLDSPHITVQLSTDFFDVRDSVSDCNLLFYTGRIDQYFAETADLRAARHPAQLEYRSLRFEFETHAVEHFQPYAVINYPDASEPFTRIVEYKHLTGQALPRTTISREYSSAEGEPYYPVPNRRNREAYEQYRQQAERLTNVHMVGRLANYKYFNMDQAFKNALDMFNRLVADG
ncbi:MAG TPA: UDP-galactopyranose mutase [Vicinamibacterales bacterium]|nr:UDP-galactopyranose mutase [Vicinamibacterales bacterium]